jgi:hypothetical protein
MNLVRGAFAGIEIAFGEKEYNCSLKAKSSYNVVFKININFLKEIEKDIKAFLEPLYIKQKQILKKLFSKNKKIKSKIESILKTSNENYFFEFGKSLKKNSIKKEVEKNLVKSKRFKFSKRYLSYDFNCNKDIINNNSIKFNIKNEIDINYNNNNNSKSKLNINNIEFNKEYRDSYYSVNIVKKNENEENGKNNYNNINSFINNIFSERKSKKFNEDKDIDIDKKNILEINNYKDKFKKFTIEKNINVSINTNDNNNNNNNNIKINSNSNNNKNIDLKNKINFNINNNNIIIKRKRSVSVDIDILKNINIDYQKNNSNKSKSEFYNLFSDCSLKDPIKKCIINWRKSLENNNNIISSKNEKLNNNNNNSNNLLSNFVNSSCRNYEEKNKYFFRTSFFNLPLISYIDEKKASKINK